MSRGATRRHTHSRVCVRTNTHAYMSGHTQTHTHSHTHTHTHTQVIVLLTIFVFGGGTAPLLENLLATDSARPCAAGHSESGFAVFDKQWLIPIFRVCDADRADTPRGGGGGAFMHLNYHGRGGSEEQCGAASSPSARSSNSWPAAHGLHSLHPRGGTGDSDED